METGIFWRKMVENNTKVQNLMLHFDLLAYVAIFQTEIHEIVILLKTASIPNQLPTKIFSQNSFLTLKMAKISLSERQNWTRNLDFRINILTSRAKNVYLS